MNEEAVVFDKVVKSRRSVRIYDEKAAFDPAAVERSLERALLAPNSSNLQLWEFYRVHTPEKKEALSALCLGQKAAVTANELIVIVTREDKWKERSQFILDKAREGFDGTEPAKEKLVEKYYNFIIPTLYRNDPIGITGLFKKAVVAFQGLSKPMPREVTKEDVRIIVHKSAALAAQTFMLSMKAEGYDSCPMEGFDSVRVKKFLQLPAKAEVNMIISVGTALPEGVYGPRVRVDSDKVVFDV